MNTANPPITQLNLYMIFYYDTCVIQQLRLREAKPGAANRRPHPVEPSRAGAGVVDHDEILPVAAAEREVPERKPHDDGDEHAGVERHDGEHEEVSQAGVDPEHRGHGHPRRPPPGGEGEGGREERRPRRVGAGGRRDGGGLLLARAPSRGELDADPERLEVLVEGGGEEQGDEGEEVAEPRGGAPAVEEDRGGLAPVEGHVHHGGRPGGNGGSG